jgi:aspartyl aminopeptidase
MTLRNDDARKSAMSLAEFIDESPTPFHAVRAMENMLRSQNFKRLREEDMWKLNILPSGRYFVTKGGSSIVAFVVGTSTLRNGFALVAAHTDSPNLHLKPYPTYSKLGYVQLGVEPYGGVNLLSWFNRDLAIAGRIHYENDNSLKSLLIDTKKAVASIPHLAIHLNPKMNDEFSVNKQTHLPPIVTIGDRAQGCGLLSDTIAKVGIDEESIRGMDLMLYGVEPSRLIGANDEFISASRLDNLASCHAAITAMCEMCHADFKPTSTCVVVCYDHEEVGSMTAQGAQSTFLRNVLKRIVMASENQDGESFDRALARSFCISADMAHAAHPNHPDKHDEHHMPIIGKGPVIKVNVNQRYASDGGSSASFEALCERAKVPFQKFVNRSDLACGTTIGPITATELGVPTVDVGNPMLSMHSIREFAGTKDHELMIRVLREFYFTDLKLFT